MGNTKLNETRHERANIDDRRVKKTKRVLKDSLFKLLEQKSINRITVSELTRLADVNRSTFYFYYKDVYDMFEQIQDEIYEVFAQDVISKANSLETLEDYIEYVTRFIIFCKENAVVCKFVMANDANNSLGKKIVNELERFVPDSTAFFAVSDPRFYLTQFAISSFLNTIVKWMNDGMKVPPRHLAIFLSYTYIMGSKCVKDLNFNEISGV